ncbi:flagellar/basal body protein [Trypanosoma theileri]|uniref:Flagellar/basal body protein n=1 Tax=Trypanosoma theileri TaxID=67003 RepID=A0A1X0P2S2_9TRYP|nr:flagellar/basal body protein [Trypanosoma theileri]ORC91227.1 flagellar/basal body protein [Trypanosoma theileri]
MSAARQNYLQIREQQQLNRERAREAAIERQREEEMIQRQKAQYNHVSSHGYGQPGGRNKDDVEIKVFIRECDGDRAQTFTFRESDATQQRVIPEPAAKPKSTNRLPALPEQLKQQQQQQLSAKAANAARGVVPKYILQRKAELAAEKEAIQREAERQKEMSKYPPGHRPVTEEERKETLAKLALRRKELEGELHKIPIRFDTQSIRARRSKIEGELREIDEAERKFSSSKQLFVPI